MSASRILRCQLAAAATNEASIAASLRAISPASAQRRTVCSNRMRKMPASRKRPCQFLLNVEWCGTGASSGKRQSQVEADFLAQPAFRRDAVEAADQRHADQQLDRKSTRLNSSH